MRAAAGQHVLLDLHGAVLALVVDRRRVRFHVERRCSERKPDLKGLPPFPPNFSTPGCKVQGAGCRVRGAGCRVQGAGCRVQGVGCRVQGAG